MRIEFLGTGGATTTPRPACTCAICVQARAKGLPYTRTGPSVFVHGPDILIDTPEEAKFQIERAGLGHISAALYSHWHPDHTLGLRMWETMNLDGLRWPPHPQTTTIYLPEQVAADFRQWYGLWNALMYFQRLRFVEVITLADGDTVTRNGVTIRPFRVAEDYVYAFLFEENGRRVLIAPDELHGWTPPDFVRGVDLAVIPMGLARVHPLTGATIIADEHPILNAEATYKQTLDIVRALHPHRVIMTHIEEAVGLSYDDLRTLETTLQADGLNISFAHDTLVVDI